MASEMRETILFPSEEPYLTDRLSLIFQTGEDRGKMEGGSYMSDPINGNHNMNYKTALQAQARCGPDHMSLLPVKGKEGSATVEAALLLPFFLCAICTLCAIAQFILAETSIYHATVQTARVYAKQQSVPRNKHPDGDGKESDTGKKIKKLGGMLDTKVVFARYLDTKAVSSSFVPGGRAGILLSPESSEDTVQVKASYVLRVPVPFFKGFILRRTIKVPCRKFTGYVSHDGKEGEEEEDVVYVAQYGRVYHTSLNCSHLSIHLTNPGQIQKVMGNARYRKCEKCIRAGQQPSQLYYTRYGDCYHSTLSCSGLKRSVAIKKKSEVKGMRVCSECGKKH